MGTPDVFITGRSFQEDEVKGRIIVVIDVLRASSTMTIALDQGARGIIAVPDMGAASMMAAKLDSRSFLLCGERDGRKIEGYHYGNSPAEFIEGKKAVKGKTLIYNSTNGAPTLARCAAAREVVIGCFLNAGAVLEYLKDFDSDDIIFVCSGWKSRLSLEDTLCAGYLLDRLLGGKRPESAPDGAQVALALFDYHKDDMSGAIAASNHAERLRKLGADADIAFCSRLNETETLPIRREGMFIKNLY
jgi:2-phosphosulfolactate phosphatase